MWMIMVPEEEEVWMILVPEEEEVWMILVVPHHTLPELLHQYCGADVTPPPLMTLSMTFRSCCANMVVLVKALWLDGPLSE